MKTKTVTKPATKIALNPENPADADTLARAKHAAWKRTCEARNAITLEQLSDNRFDVNVALSTMRAAHERALPFRERLIDELRHFDPSCIDRLPEYCDAMAYAYERAHPPTKETPAELNAGAEKHLAMLMCALAPLAAAGLFPADVYEDLRNGTRWHDRAADLGRIATVATDCWPQIEGRTTITKKDLANAVIFSRNLYAYLGTKGQPQESPELQLERRQAITVAVEAYEELRRAMSWLRWRERDASKIVPSVYANPYARARRSSSDESGDEEGGATDPRPDADPAKPGEAKSGEVKSGEAKPAQDPKRPVVIDKGPMLGADGKPLVPQDDPFAKE